MPNLLLLARRGAKRSKADYDARIADDLTRQQEQQSTSVRLIRILPNSGKYEGETIYGDRVQGDFFGLNAPVLNRRYAFSRQKGSQFGFFTDA